MNERLEKLARLAFDPSAAPGEAENAAVALVREARRQGVTFRDLFAPAPAPHAPGACGLRMPFGKYKGCTLGEIAENDISYIGWLHSKAKLRPPLRSAVDEVFSYYVGVAA